MSVTNKQVTITVAVDREFWRRLERYRQERRVTGYAGVPAPVPTMSDVLRELLERALQEAEHGDAK